MATAAQLAAKVGRGYGIAAGHLGSPCDWYRCTNTGPVIVSGNKLGTLPVNFTPDLKYGKNQPPGKNNWIALVDGTQVHQGDYLVDPQGVAWYIANLRDLLPPQAVQCNRVVTFKRAAGPSSVGLGGYGGDVEMDETVLATGWPASVLSATRKGSRTDARLPGDEVGEWWDILLPAVPGLSLHLFDIIYDDLLRRAVISSAEFTPENSWRITAEHQVT